MYRLGVLIEVSKFVGTGHFWETLTLLNELNSTRLFKSYIFYSGDKKYQKILENSGIDLLGFQRIKSLEKAVESYRFNDLDLIYLNSTRRGSEFYEKINKNGAPILAIFDDHEKEDYGVKAYINTSILALETKDVPKHHYLGPDYLIFNPALIKKRYQLNAGNPGTLPSVLLTMGGTDPYELTTKVIHCLYPLKDNIKLQVVLTDGFDETQILEVKGYARRNKNVQVFMNLSSEDMYNTMLQSDIAISAAGNTLYELCLLGIPTVVVPHHILHDKVANKFEERGAIVNMGIDNYLDGNKLCNALQTLLNDSALRNSLSRNARNITDGHGLERTVKIIYTILEES